MNNHHSCLQQFPFSRCSPFVILYDYAMVSSQPPHFVSARFEVKVSNMIPYSIRLTPSSPPHPLPLPITIMTFPPMFSNMYLVSFHWHPAHELTALTPAKTCTEKLWDYLWEYADSRRTDFPPKSPDFVHPPEVLPIPADIIRV